MQYNNKELHTDHISIDELDAVAAMDADDLSFEDIAQIKVIERKVEACSICQARYLFYAESEAAIALLTPKPVKYAARIADLLRERLDSMGDVLAAADVALQNKINQWLEGAQDVLQSFSAPPLKYAAAGSATRGTGGADGADNVIEIAAEIDEDGFFEFSLPEASSVRLTVSKNTEFGRPICLVLTGKNDTDFAEIYPLTALGRESLRSPKIELNAGDYALCIPTEESESE